MTNLTTDNEYVDQGHKLSSVGRISEAETYFRAAIAMNPAHAMAHNNFGWTRQMQGDSEAAVSSYQKALELDPQLIIARRNLAQLLVQLGRRDESLYLWKEEMNNSHDGLKWMEDLISTSMQNKDLMLAGEYAAVFAEIRLGGILVESSNHDETNSHSFNLTIPKLQHDIDQFQYLQRHGVIGDEFSDVINNYRQMIDNLTQIGGSAQPNREEHYSIFNIFNRIVHLRDTPRQNKALSDSWDPSAAEYQYLNNPPGVVVIDDFLTNEALEEVRLFCLESTVWSGNRYAHGRLGAFFNDGFNCPLLLQIAEEIRHSLPKIIIDKYPLRQLWGFKYDRLPKNSTIHADFAAVNVNFWITPEDANLDPNSGGLVIYDVGSPSEWNFETYNRRPDIIERFLEEQGSRAYTIPYRQNRAIIFNSDLFHATAAVRFKPEYENRRINITMLYGDREDDIIHPPSDPY